MEDGLEIEAFSTEGGDGLQGVGGALPFIVGPAVAAVGGDGACDLQAFWRRISGDDDLRDTEISEQRGNALNPLKYGFKPSFLPQGQGHIGGGRLQISLRQFGAQLVWFGGEEAVGADFRTLVSGRCDSVQHLGKGEAAGLAAAKGKDVPADGGAAYLYV